MRMKEDILNLECKLTDTEKLNYGKIVSESNANRIRLTESLKAYNKQVKAEIESEEAKINELTHKINVGSEFRMIKCNIEYDFDKRVKAWIRQDTGEIAKDDIIPESELQKDAFEE